MTGSTLRKVKSRSWKKQRHFRLLDDGLTIWYKSRWAGMGHSTCEYQSVCTRDLHTVYNVRMRVYMSPLCVQFVSVLHGKLWHLQHQSRVSIDSISSLVLARVPSKCMQIPLTIPYTDYVSVSVSEVEAVREGHQSEVLLSIAEEFPADLCFTLVFHGRQGNMDLVAESPEEARAWIQGVRKLIHKAETMDEKARLDQYPSTVVP